MVSEERGTARSAESVPVTEGLAAVAQLTPSLPAIGATIRIIKMGKSLKITCLGELPKTFRKI